jgi:hypothetical protein
MPDDSYGAAAARATSESRRELLIESDMVVPFSRGICGPTWNHPHLRVSKSFVKSLANTTPASVQYEQRTATLTSHVVKCRQEGSSNAAPAQRITDEQLLQLGSMPGVGPQRK